jgi:DnaJ-class molecular chaperone
MNNRIGPDMLEFHDDDEDYDDDWACTHCGGEGFQENDDPLWHGFDKGLIPCRACDGTGEREHQTIF